MSDYKYMLWVNISFGMKFLNQFDFLFPLVPDYSKKTSQTKKNKQKNKIKLLCFFFQK